MNARILFITVIALTTPAFNDSVITPLPAAEAEDAFQAARQLNRGINLGNMLDAPREGAWGVRFDDSFPVLIRKAGFDHVRIPVRWSAHLDSPDGSSIDLTFMKRVRTVVDQCVNNDLRVVLNVHHFEEIHTAPLRYADTLQNIWACISRDFFGYSRHLYFELLNEPHAQLTTERWNQIFPGILRTIRKRHPDRCVIIGPGEWNSHTELPALQLPVDDRFLIATCHYYEPFEFTHQGAEWLQQSAPSTGRRFPATELEVNSIGNDFQTIARWSQDNRRPVYIGEFGSYSRAGMSDRVYWTGLITQHARQHGFSWAYWEFCSTFGIYDPTEARWHRMLLHQLVPHSKKASE